jgi:hypothetical protein
MSNAEFFRCLRVGRRTEQRVIFLLRQQQLFVTELAAIQGVSGPRAYGFGEAVILPDLLGSQCGWTGAFECKDKESGATFHRKTRTWEQGIDLELFEQYRKFQQISGIRVVLVIYEKPTDEFLAASLDRLGEPRLWLDRIPGYGPMAYWPRNLFRVFHVGPHHDVPLFQGQTLPPTLPPFDVRTA